MVIRLFVYLHVNKYIVYICRNDDFLLIPPVRNIVWML